MKTILIVALDGWYDAKGPPHRYRLVFSVDEQAQFAFNTETIDKDCLKAIADHLEVRT